MSKVTVLLAAYKGNDYVGAMIDSILAQDCDDWELVVSDDGAFTEHACFRRGQERSAGCSKASWNTCRSS